MGLVSQMPSGPGVISDELIAEIAATVAKEVFWYLDAPVDRLCVEDVPMPYHPVLLNAVLPDAERIAARIEVLLMS